MSGMFFETQCRLERKEAGMKLANF